MAKKKDTGFNNPFAQARQALERVIKPPPEKKVTAAPAPPPAPPPVDEGRLFADEMAGVARMVEDTRGRVGAPEHVPSPVSRHQADEAEAYASLADLIEGAGPFDFADTDEFIEGTAPGIDRRLVKRLKKGDFSVEAHIDLHGKTRDLARDAVERFLATARSEGKRCVLIVHGRGLNSKDQVPVLKERLKVWLEKGRISRSVLAFTSARPCDGGTGAVYVLLRRWSR